MLALLPPDLDERPVAFGAEGTKTYGDLRALALAFSRRAEAAKRVLLLCEDRFLFTAALLGAKVAGCQVLLPPHRGKLARGALGSDALVAHDSDEENGFDVRTLAPVAGPFELVVNASDGFVELFTSGSTGEPEAYRKSARQLLGEAEALVEVLSLTPSSRIVATVSPQHIYGLLFGVLAPLRAGASFSRETPRFPRTLESCVETHRATHLVAVPAHLQGCTEWSASARPLLVTSGAPLREDLAQELSKKGFRGFDVLGSSETGGYGLREIQGSGAFRGLPGVRFEQRSEGVLLWSPFLTDPDEPFPLTDALEFSPDGTFRHLGRVDDVVKVGGKRVALGEIESIARSLPGVLDAWCVAEATEDTRGQRLTLLAVAPGYSEPLLLERLRGALDAALVPRRIRLVDRLPELPSGKRDRRAARALLDAAEETRPLDWVVLERTATLVRERTSLPRNFPAFRGHFPEAPVLPAVALLDSLVLPRVRAAFPPLSRLTGLSRWKLTAPLLPGEEVTIHLELREATRVDFTISAGARVASTGRAFFAEGTRAEPTT